MESDRQCTATSKQSGQRCRRYAHPGATVCVIHGAAAPRAKAAAARRREQEAAQRAVALFGAPKDVEPSQALLDLVHWTAGEVEYWREQVRQLAADEPAALTWGKTREKTGGQDGGDTYEAKPHVAYVMLYAAQDRLAQYATAALKAGVAERQVRIAEQQGAQFTGAQRTILARMFQAMLDLLRAQGVTDDRIMHALTEGWAEAMSIVVPEEMQRLAGGNTP